MGGYPLMRRVTFINTGTRAKWSAHNIRSLTFIIFTFKLESEENNNEEVRDYEEALPNTDFEESNYGHLKTTKEMQIIKSIVKALFLLETSMFLPDPFLENILGAFCLFIYLINGVIEHQLLVSLLNIFSVNLCKARKLIQIQDHNFVKYVVCSKCEKLYSYENGQKKVNFEPIFCFQITHMQKKENNVEIC